MGFKDAVLFRSRSRSDSTSPPPPYTEEEEAAQKQFHDQLAERTSNLSLDEPEGSFFPTADQAYVHLKLLHAISTLRKEISEHDGLFQLHNQDVLDGLVKSGRGSDSDTEKQLLAKLAEKRWAIYVARAADRFAVWWEKWRAMTDARTLTMEATRRSNVKDGDWMNGHGKRISLTQANLPPLDILMVWHAFMLNPRCYLEDCYRQDMMSLWNGGMPWSAVNASIDASTGRYDPGEAAVQDFTAVFPINWSNIDDPDIKSFQCPKAACRNTCTAPWTTLSRTDLLNWASYANASLPFPAGHGYGDPQLHSQCTSCSTTLDHDMLRVGKFVRDSDRLMDDDANAVPMPGTILDAYGTIGNEAAGVYPRLVPNQLLRAMLREKDSRSQWKSVTDIRDAIELAVHDKGLVKQSNKVDGGFLRQSARTMMRKMMSRYWTNSSIFSLDLVGAVIRQGAFVEKMENIDWLHSPTGLSTMARLVTKYSRFFSIMASRLDQTSVPTLDVDLLWHTNQLTPANYYGLCMENTEPSTFIDHDDKIGETKLHDAFSQTTKIYQKRYKEPYSECTCWYCESVRASLDPATSRLLSRSSALHAAEERMLYDPSNPVPSDQERSPHISTHNVVRPLTRDDRKTRQEFDVKNKDLASYVAKAVGRARKQGKPISSTPTRLNESAYNRPESSREAKDKLLAVGTGAGAGVGAALFLHTGAFSPNVGTDADGSNGDGTYVSNPSCASVAPGTAGNCASGTCGGLAAAGSCADAAGLGAGGESGVLGGPNAVMCGYIGTATSMAAGAGGL